MLNMCPRMAARPVQSHRVREAGEEVTEGIMLATSIAGRAPFATSRAKHRYAHFLPSARATFVAPRFPEPTFARSMLWSFAIMSAKGTEPRR